MISLDIVPSTVRQAAELLATSLDDDQRKYFRTTPPETIRLVFAGAIRAGWSMWEMNTPLQRDAIKHYAIAHAEDVSSLIVYWARALVLGEDFRWSTANATISIGLHLAQRRWRLRDGRRGEGEALVSTMDVSSAIHLSLLAFASIRAVPIIVRKARAMMSQDCAIHRVSSC